MFCRGNALNYAGFFALHFPIVRFPFSHRDGIETNLQNLNIPSRVPLCRHLAPRAEYRAVGARSYFHSRPPAARTAAGRQAIHHPPPPAARKRHRQRGGRWASTCGTARRFPPLSAPRLPGWRCPRKPLRSPRPEADRYARVTGPVCALSPPLVAGRAAGTWEGRTQPPCLHAPALDWSATHVRVATRTLPGSGL